MTISLRRYYPYQVKGFGIRHLSRLLDSTPDFMRLFGMKRVYYSTLKSICQVFLKN